MKYRKYWTGMLGACVLNWGAFAAEPSPAERDARKLGDALVARDYMTVASLTHPAVVKAAGGPEKVVRQLQAANAGLTTHSMTFHEPAQITEVGGTRIAVFPYRTTVTLNGKTVEFDSFYIGFTADRRNWKFIDCEGITQEFLEHLLPGYKRQLTFNGC